MKSGIYIISYDDKNYVGSAVNLKDRYAKHLRDLKKGNHHNKIMQRCYNKHGIDNLKYKIVAKCPKEYLLKLEQWFIDNTLNLMNHALIAGHNFLGLKHTEETKKIIGAKSKLKIYTDELRARMSIARKGFKHSEESLIKMSKSQKGKVRNEKWLENMSKGRKGIGLGRKVSLETRAKLSKAHSGKKFTEEHRKNISKVKIGIKHTEEQKLKQSIRNRGQNNPNAKLTLENVIEIRNLFGKMKMKEIANKFNVSISTIEKLKAKETWIV